MHLYLQQGDTTEQLTGNLQFKFEGFKVSTVETTVEIEPDYNKLFKDAYESSTVPKPIVTINGVAPTDRGAFFIDGSECDSWGEIKGSTAFPIGEALKNEHDQLIDGGTASGIWLVDLCPSCTTCENVYRLQYETENLRMWINTLKDVNLMVSTAANSANYDQVFDDNQELSSKRVSGITKWNGYDWRNTGTPLEYDANWEACHMDLTPDDSFMRVRGLNLLKEYITTVHMWNYVVSQNNSSTEIQIAPESEAGFVIQTKRSLPSCGGDQQIRCLIDVDVMSGESDTATPFPTHLGPQDVMADNGTTLTTIPLRAPYRLSTFIPKATIEFKPFKNTVADQCAPATESSMEAIPVSGMTTTFYPDVHVVIPDLPNDPIEYDRNTHKTFDTTIIGSTVAGTYIATVKVLPFINRKLYNANGTEISIRGRETSAAGMDAEPIHEDPTDPTSPIVDIKYSFISGFTEYIAKHENEQHVEQPRPTEEDYLSSLTAPTRSVPFDLMWNIVVKWEVYTPGSTEAPQTYTQTYNYQCNSVRVYYGVGMSSIQLRPLLPVDGGTTSA